MSSDVAESSVLDGGGQAAAAAARRASVDVRPVTALADLEAMSELYAAIWRSDANPPMTTELLRALSKVGSYVAGAFDGASLVGASVGFFSAPAERVLHSHIAGVSPSSRLRNVGFAMKLHQRAWALQRGVSMIEWTYDPLVSRNAYFNIAKLAGDPAEYLPNFYGAMGDVINRDDASDRILVHWRLRDPQVADACAFRPRLSDVASLREGGAGVALACSPDGAPVAGASGSVGAARLVAVPSDIESLRAGNPRLASEWRVALRETLLELMGSGFRITGFDRAGWYVLTPPTTTTDEK